MRLSRLFLVTIGFIPSVVSSSFAAQTITGKLVDKTGSAFAGVKVSAGVSGLQTSSDERGLFTLKNIPDGKVSLNFSGADILSKNMVVSGGTDTLKVVLKESVLRLPATVVTAEPTPVSVLQSISPTTVITGRELDRSRGMNLMNTIDNTPGARVSSGGPLSSKPVIRGLSGQRVLVLRDNLPTASQSWDDPQSPELNAFDAERIEVVRGPMSVLYGSDALGGVVNVITQKPWETWGDSSLIHGVATINGYTNALQGAGSLALGGKLKGLSYSLNAAGRGAGDYSAPAGTVADGSHVSAGKVTNTGAGEFDAGLSVEGDPRWGRLIFNATNYFQKYQISPEPGRMEIEQNAFDTSRYDTLPAMPHQEILHTRGNLDAYIPADFGHWNLDLTYQLNSRKEEGVSESRDAEMQKKKLKLKPEALLILNDIDFESKYNWNGAYHLGGSAGVSGSVKINSTEGQKAIVPDFSSLNGGAFAFATLSPAPVLKFSLGGRVDEMQLSASANDQLEIKKTTKDYTTFTGSGGLAFTPLEFLEISGSVGRGWRAPVAAELFFNGADEGAARYKVGDASLVPEQSLNVDGTVKVSAARVSVEGSIFHNNVDHYIYLAPTADFDSATALRKYKYTQADAELFGGEFATQVSVTKWMILNAGLDMVRGRNVDAKKDLPLIPADRVTGGVKFTLQNIAIAKHPYLQLTGRYFAKQEHIADFESVTPSYYLFDAGLGCELPLKTRDMTIDLLAENLLNRAYYDHLSRYKEYALDPGLDIELKCSVPFGIGHRK